MELGRATIYGVTAAVYLAEQQRDQPIQAKEIAGQCHIPLKYLVKVMRSLERRGIFVSKRGRSGGYRLKRQPRQTTILSIVEALEGRFDHRFGFRHFDISRGAVSKRLSGACNRVVEEARETFGAMTIFNFVATGSGNGAGGKPKWLRSSNVKLMRMKKRRAKAPKSARGLQTGRRPNPGWSNL